MSNPVRLTILFSALASLVVYYVQSHIISGGGSAGINILDTGWRFGVQGKIEVKDTGTYLREQEELKDDKPYLKRI